MSVKYGKETSERKEHELQLYIVMLRLHGDAWHGQ